LLILKYRQGPAHRDRDEPVLFLLDAMSVENQISGQKMRKIEH
jgi:hypothetical protein